MKTKLAFVMILLLSLLRAPMAEALAPACAEMAQLRRWVAARFEGGAKPCFSFTCAGKPSADLLPSWQQKRESRRLDDHKTERTLTCADPNTGLEVRCVAVEYSDYPVVEWTVYFRNAGHANTPILQNIQALDTPPGTRRRRRVRAARLQRRRLQSQQL